MDVYGIRNGCLWDRKWMVMGEEMDGYGWGNGYLWNRKWMFMG